MSLPYKGGVDIMGEQAKSIIIFTPPILIIVFAMVTFMAGC